MVLSKSLVSYSLAVHVWISLAYSQSIMDRNTPIPYHTTKSSSQRFITSRPSGFEDTKSLIPLPAYLFGRELDNLPSEAGTYDGLPLCKSSKVRLQPRAANENSFKSLNVVVYQFDNKEHQKRAKPLGSLAQPYIEGALVNPFRPQGDQAQTILRVLGVECLPTRVRSIKKAGQSFFEYAEGSQAWRKR